MAGPNLDIPFPKLGLSEYTAYTEQPPLTTPSVKNWVLRDPSTGRLRGGQRAGTTRYVSTQVNSTNAVQCVTSLNRQNPRVAYTVVNSGNGPRNAEEVVWAADVPDARLGDVRAMSVDRFGNVYVLSGKDGLVCKYGGDGNLVWKHTVPLTATSDSVYHTLYCIQVDYDGDLFIGVGGTSGANSGLVYRFQQVRDGLEEVFRYTEFAGLVADIAIEGQWMYVAENTGDGYKLHRIGGIKTRSPFNEWTYDLSGTAVNQPATAVGILPDGCCVVSYRYDTASSGAGDNQPNTGRVAVISQQGRQLAMYGDTDTEGGCGWGMDIDSDGNVYVTGRQQGGAGNATDTLVKLAWNGSALSRTWGFNGGTGGAVDYGMPGSFQGPDSLCVDRDGRVYVGLEDGTNTHNLLRFTAAGALDWAVGVAEFSDIYAIRPDAFYPVADDVPTYGALGLEHVFVGGNDIGGSGVYSLFKLRVLNAAITDSTPRSLQVLACAGGTIKVRTNATTWTAPSGGTGALDTNLRFVSAVAGYDKVYFTDGETYVYYDPDGDSGNGSVATWRAEKGRLPPRCKLIAIWNNRLVLARGSDDPFNWYMSRAGDFEDWDFFPFPPDVGQAVAGNTSAAGLCPDIVNALIPYSDDLLIIGGDHSLWRMTGDPADGGRWDMISDITGVAYGKAWCKSPDGVLYFLGSRGGVFAYAPGGVPTEISNAFIRERLAALEFDEVRVQLVWNDREQCVMVFVCSAASIPMAESSYIYDANAGGWWPFDFASTAVTAKQVPLSIHVIDGDEAADRRLLIGTHLGYVWYWDVTADSDDDGNSNYVIDADIYLGPIVPFEGRETRLTKVYSVLGYSSAAADLSVFGSDSPDFNDKGTAQYTGTDALSSNRTTTINLRARGNALWLRVRNNTASERVQVESLRLECYEGGRVRVRS